MIIHIKKNFIKTSTAAKISCKFNRNEESQSEASMQVDQPIAKQYSQDYVQHANEYQDKFADWSINEQVRMI